VADSARRQPMTITRVILLVMAVFVVIYALRVLRGR
jgi:hypothetical protein